MRVTFILITTVLLLSTMAVARDPITLYLAGDSTMAHKLASRRPETGWGECLQQHFDEAHVRVENHAKNGRSTKSFIAEGLWQAIVDKLKRGDYVFIEFGHNDESPKKVGRYTTPEEFGENLARMVSDIRAKHAHPVLLTPVVRRKFDRDGKLVDTHGVYPDVTRDVAARLHVPLIDMQRMSAKVVQQHGKAGSRGLYLQLAPGENPNYPKGVHDNTHFNPTGAAIMANLAVEGIAQDKLKIAPYLTPAKGGVRP